MVLKSKIIEEMQHAAIAAGRSLLRDFGEIEQLQVSRKGAGDFVSAADKKAEEIIIKNLKSFKPKYSFLCEETGEHKGIDHNHVWVIDPLDGTFNFLHGIPHFAVSIGLQEIVKGGVYKNIAGVVYAPVLNEMYWAEENVGAFIDTDRGSKKLKISKRNELDTLLISCYIPKTEKGGKYFTTLPYRRRVLGCAALELAYLAAGKIDGFYDAGLKQWDIAAGSCIAEQAGAVIKNIDGTDITYPDGNIFGATPHVDKEFSKDVAEVFA